MSEGYDVNVDEVRAHAATIETISGQVSSAGPTQPSTGADAYGAVASFFASAVTLAADQVCEAITQSARSVMDVRTGVTASADAYQQAEEANASMFAVADGGAATTAAGTGAGAGQENTGGGTVRGTSPVTPASSDGPFVQGDVVPVKLGRKHPPSTPGQRAKALAVLSRISQEKPISVATVALGPVRWAHERFGDFASAQIGDHYERDVAPLLRQPPTDANLRQMAETETKFWNSDEGNKVGAWLLGADSRYALLVRSRDSWLSEMPPAERGRIAEQLGVRLRN